MYYEKTTHSYKDKQQEAERRMPTEIEPSQKIRLVLAREEVAERVVEKLRAGRDQI
jgi:hypothetical protein